MDLFASSKNCQCVVARGDEARVRLQTPCRSRLWCFASNGFVSVCVIEEWPVLGERQSLRKPNVADRGNTRQSVQSNEPLPCFRHGRLGNCPSKLPHSSLTESDVVLGSRSPSGTDIARGVPAGCPKFACTTRQTGPGVPTLNGRGFVP